jgi:ankyrin repeat protein
MFDVECSMFSLLNPKRTSNIRKGKLLLPLILLLLAATAFLARTSTPLRNALLWRAVSWGSTPATKLMIWTGADVNVRDAYGATPLFAAAGHGHPEVVRLLLQSGADALVLDDRGETALAYSIASGSPNSPACDELLINAGCLPKQANPLTHTWSSLTAASHVKLLLEHGVDPSSYSGAALRRFAYDGNVATMAVLLEHGARVNAVGEDGRTALSEAVAQGWPDAVKFLIDHGADKTVQLNGRSLVDIARSKRDEMVSYRATAAVPRYDAVLRYLTGEPQSPSVR